MRALDRGFATDIFPNDLVLKMTIAVFQACTQLLSSQQSDGGWEASPELTAYAILTLADVRHSFLFEGDLQRRIIGSIEAGGRFLDNYDASNKPEGYWTSKTNYSVDFVHEAYVLAALKVAREPFQVSQTDCTTPGSRSSTTSYNASRYMPLLRQTKSFSSVPEWQLQAWLAVSALFVPLLQARRLDVFARDEYMGEDSYLELIPFTWIGCNARMKSPVPTAYAFDMMILSMLCFQLDEFMETVAPVASNSGQDWDALHSVIDEATETALRGDARLSSSVRSSPQDSVSFSQSLCMFPNLSLNLYRSAGPSNISLTTCLSTKVSNQQALPTETA